MKSRLSFSITFIFSCLLWATNAEAQIPTISITSQQEIQDEPKVPATFIYTGINGEVITSDIGIEIRGGFSQGLPKKTYDIEFWDDPEGEETRDVQFGSLREDDDWILDAMYNEPLRINSFFAHKLWLEMNQLYYQDEEPNAKSGADVMYVEVTVNGEFQGIYMLSEQIDRKQLKLKKNVGTEIHGELYKAHDNDDAAFFNNPDNPPNNNSDKWSGYEFKYPSDFIDWVNVEALVLFVANSTDEAFKAGIEDRFDFKSVMDYFILINAGRLLDNRAKNIYLGRYDVGQPYFFAPWDLDGSWGLLWNGSNAPETNGILTNNLYDRLIANDVNGFRQKISNRWFELRATLLSNEQLEIQFTNLHDFLLSNDVYAREEEVWEYEYDASDLNYLLDWVDDRLVYLDDYFNTITNVEEEKREAFFLYPNPAQDYINFSSDIHSGAEIKIFNILSNEVVKTEILKQKNSIFIGDLLPGLYILELNGSNQLFHKN